MMCRFMLTLLRASMRDVALGDYRLFVTIRGRVGLLLSGLIESAHR